MEMSYHLLLLFSSYYWCIETGAFLSTVPSATRHDDLLLFRKIASRSCRSSCRTTTNISYESLASSSGGVATKEPQEDEDKDGNTVVSITNPETDQIITLIGTAHLSTKSNDQVQRVIEALRPNVVMVEMDKSRLERIGIDSINNINVNRVTTSDDIELPMLPPINRPNRLSGIFQRIFIQIFTQIARTLLTNMYDAMGDQMNAKGGGEFLRAIQSAENCTVCDTVILGDRNSLVTIQRAAELALESGDFIGVAKRLQNVNNNEMDELEKKVREELLQEKGDNSLLLDESEVTTALMEKLKDDKKFRLRLFSKLERHVPEFTQAFLKERDYLMSESVLRELERSEVVGVVGVVGLAHVPGMEKHFRSVFAGKPAPLIENLASTDAIDSTHNQ